MNARERVRRRFDRWVTQQRIEKMSQAQIGEIVGKSQGWVSKATAKGPRLEDLDEVAALMGQTAADLVAPGSAENSRVAIGSGPAPENDEAARLGRRAPTDGRSPVPDQQISPFVELIAAYAKRVEELHDRAAIDAFEARVLEAYQHVRRDFQASDEESQEAGSQ